MDYLDHLVLVVFLVSQDHQALMDILDHLVPEGHKEEQVQLAHQDQEELQGRLDRQVKMVHQGQLVQLDHPGNME